MRACILVYVPSWWTRTRVAYIPRFIFSDLPVVMCTSVIIDFFPPGFPSCEMPVVNSQRWGRSTNICFSNFYFYDVSYRLIGSTGSLPTGFRFLFQSSFFFKHKGSIQDSKTRFSYRVLIVGRVCNVCWDGHVVSASGCRDDSRAFEPMPRLVFHWHDDQTVLLLSVRDDNKYQNFWSMNDFHL